MTSLLLLCSQIVTLLSFIYVVVISCSFYEQYVPNTFRIVYSRDIVVRLPFCNTSGCDAPGPNHFGTEVPRTVLFSSMYAVM